jgi:hypothetical protein
MSFASGVTASVGALCLLGAVLIATVGGMHWPRIAVVLTLTGATGVLNGTIGPTVHRGMSWAAAEVNPWVRSWIQVSVLVILALVLLGLAGFWVYQNQIDNKTLGVVFAVPATVTLIPGPAGTLFAAAVGIVPAIVGTLVGWAFGLG